MSKTHPLERAWAAGVFDARVSMPKSGYVLRVESTDQPMMERFAKALEVGTFKERDHKLCSHPVYLWNTTSMDQTRDALLLLSPFLSGIRIKQAADLIAKIERNPIWHKNNPEKANSTVINTPASSADQKTT
jgi:hypothetical protein